MSLIKELKLNSENQINLVDVIQTLCPNDKTKYVDLLLRLIKKTKDISRVSNEIKRELEERLGVDPKRFDKYTPFQMVIIYQIINASFNTEDLKNFNKFIEYNERGLIVNNDLSRFISFDEILNATALAEIKAIEKEMEKQVKILHNDSEWLVLRPLTYQSSLKYGSSTKWCTSSDYNPEYFFRYVKRGLLIYMISKITGKKVAFFKSLDKNEPEFSFWNQIGQRIDSLEADLPDIIINLIKNELINHSVTNFSLLSDAEKLTQDELLKKNMDNMIIENPVSMDIYPTDMEDVESPTEEPYSPVDATVPPF